MTEQREKALQLAYKIRKAISNGEVENDSDLANIIEKSYPSD